MFVGSFEVLEDVAFESKRFDSAIGFRGGGGRCGDGC
jgi:hypothetical protein